MQRMVVKLGGHVKVQLRRLRKSTKNVGLAFRCQMVLQAAKGRSSRTIAQNLGASRSWVCRVIRRFLRHGVAGLMDRREDNGVQKLSESYLNQLVEVVSKSPLDYGHRRPTWTRELLVEAMAKLTGVEIHPATMSRALRRIGARRGRPRPTVACPWPKPRKERRLRRLRRLAEDPPAGDVVVYADEADIHLNPKIGLDWMNRGQQKEVLTPGQNEKRYIAGALDATTGRLTCVEAARKNSYLFVGLLSALVKAYPQAGRIHVILDNYRIHHSAIAKIALGHFARRVVLHFLPPYCPQANKIERVWLDLHAEATRNHQHARMGPLMKDVWRFIGQRNRGHATPILKIAA